MCFFLINENVVKTQILRDEIWTVMKSGKVKTWIKSTISNLIIKSNFA